MSITRRDFLLLMAGSTGAIALGNLTGCERRSVETATQIAKAVFPFNPIRGVIPVETLGLPVEQQKTEYASLTVADDVVLPEGYGYQIVAAWGDKVGDSRFGYNNDYLSFVPIPGQAQAGYLTVNFEYISAIPWMETYTKVIGKSLPFAEVKASLQKSSGKIDAFALADTDPLKAQIREICREALIDQGLGIISIRQGDDGSWQKTNSSVERRITGISGLEDQRYLRVSGPAIAIFRKSQGMGYIDKLGDRVIGSFANCAGGTTPWGTVLSAEENFQMQVPEPVYPDGTSLNPKERPFAIDDEEIMGQGNVFGLAGNKYGWIVEVDPSNPKDFGTKHTWLGRYRHEAVGIRVEPGKPIAFYSGCDRRGGHVYKFVSRDPVTTVTDKSNSQLLSSGMLYAAKYNPDGTGKWIPLAPDTPIAPDSPQDIAGNILPLPPGPPASPKVGKKLLSFNDEFEPIEGFHFVAKSNADINVYKQKYRQLADLYVGTPEEKQGIILIDAHYAANAVGATCTARPEDTVVAPNGDLYISFTSGSPGKEGGPDLRIFAGPQGETPYEYGWVMRLVEDNNDPSASTFRWQMLATGGEPASGGMGFANPDNLLLDRGGNVWMVTDISTKKMNNAVKSRTDDKGKTASISGLFGNNSLWYIPTSGEKAGQAFLFGTGPMECEMTGPCFTPDYNTLFIAVQHPGEAYGIRKNQASETREFLVRTTTGEVFTQSRQVPLGSNWPGKTPDAPPKPAVIAIRKT